MSAISTATRAVFRTPRRALRAPKWVWRKMEEHPRTAGLVVLGADVFTKLTARLIGEFNTCFEQASICLQTYYNNQGDFANSSFTQFLFGLGAVSLAYLFTKTNWQKVQVAISMLAGCAVGQIGEAAIFGSNVDFIKIGFWPTFNIADTANTLGLLTLLYDCGSRGKNSQEKPTRKETIKNSFTRNIWNTIGQTYLYAISVKYVVGFFKLPAIPVYLLLSLLRDIRHRGEGRMFQ